MGYEYVHSGLFWQNSTPYPLEKNIEYIFAFWPVLPTKYENKIGKADYDAK